MYRHYRSISDYGAVGDLRTVALVGLNGSIDWLCLPFIDSPSVFGALLDGRKGGRFSVSPAGDWDSSARYLPGTNILETRFRTPGGVLRLTDFMPLADSGRHLDEDRHELYRLLEVERGHVTAAVVFDPRFDYGRADTRVEQDGGVLTARGGGEVLSLSASRPPGRGEGGEGWAWDLRGGDRVWLRLRYGGGTVPPPDAAGAEEALRETARFWRGWLEGSETGRTFDAGPYRGEVERSALVLKLLSFQPTGAVAAAATASLPEEVGGARNWDYRYTWIRDTSFTLQALFNLGHLSETEAFLQWVERLLSVHGAARMQIMYGVRGESELPEEELTHLEGYKGSRPVRIGNRAAGQRQLDIYGEIMDAALKLSDYVGKIDSELWPLLRDICELVRGSWREKDSGIWEVRGGPHHFVHSKVMCWAALDRGVTIARRYGFPGDLKGWEREMGEIRREVLTRGWSEARKAFRQHYGTDDVDASALLIPLLGFLPAADRRVVSTVSAVRSELEEDGLLYRYRGGDGVPGGEGTFLLCSAWLAQYLVARGDTHGARAVLRRLEGAANHLGLFSEEYDTAWKEALGNFPQAFTHIGYVNAVFALRQAEEREKGRGVVLPRPPPARGLLLGKMVLNEGDPPEGLSPEEAVPRLKASMNTLRGAFFDTAAGRVAYERMRDSEAYRRYVELSRGLAAVDLDSLRTREERIAFWMNLYNVIVIHGVIGLGVRDSVREIVGFFGRIRYRIGGLLFSADDMEHGILRANRHPPHSLFRPFGRRDGRLRHRIDPMDPRIHFGLVCASLSCPPIELYTPVTLEKELTIAAETFLNSGGAVVDAARGEVSLSRIFKWYAADFGGDQTQCLRFVAPYLHDRAARVFLQERAGEARVTYQAYDWRLNRS